MRATANIAALAIAAILLLSITPTTTIHDGFDSDGRYYAAMSGVEGIPGLAETTIKELSPWNQRVLIPYVVSKLLVDGLAGFLIVNQVSNLLVLLLLFFILRHYTDNKPIIFFTLLIYATVFWTIQFSIFSPFYIDSATMVFTCLIILLTLKRQTLLLVPTIVISSLAKESLPLLIVFSAYYLFFKNVTLREISLQNLKKPLLFFGFTTITVLVLREVLNIQTNPLLLFMPGWQVISFFKNIDALLVLLQAAFSGTGVLMIIALLDWRFCADWIKSNPEWIVYFFLCIYLLFGGHDKARLFLPLLPMLAILFSKILVQVEGHNSKIKFLAFLNLMFFANMIFGGLLFGLENTETYLAKLVPEHSSGTYLPYLMLNIGVLLTIFLYIWLSKTRLASIESLKNSMAKQTGNYL